MIWLRRLAFWSFTALYLVIGPLTIFYALGYLLAPGPEPSIVETGLVYVSTVPPGATVYLGHRRDPHRTPTVLRGLRPGTYQIHLAFKHHRVWSCTVPVEAGQATVLDHVLLRPAAWPSRELSPAACDQLIPIPGSRALLLTRGPVLGDALCFTWDDGRIRPLLPPQSAWRNARIRTWTTVRDSPILLLRVIVEDGERILWLNPRRVEHPVVEVTPWVPLRASRVAWSPRAPARLFVWRDGALTRLDVLAGDVWPQLVNHVRGLGVSNGTLYVLTEDARLRRMEADGRNPVPVLDDAALGRSLFGSEGWFDITVLSKDRLLFLGERGQLVANQLPYRFVEEGVQGVAWDARRERLLLWQPRRLGVLDYAKDVRPNDLFERGPQLHWVLTDGTRVDEAFWVYEGSHALCRSRDQMRLLELETYGPPRVEPIVSVSRRSAVWYEEETGTLYYLHPATGRLCALELLPKREILPLPFPQQKTEPVRRSEIREP